MVTIKSKKEIELMREAGRVTALTHKAIEEAIKPGMTTADIDRMLTRRVCTNQDCKATYNIKLHPPVKEGICDKCGSPLKQRADDSDPEAIKRRLEIYEEKTSPLVEYYKEKGVLRTETVSISINRMGKDVANDVVKDIKK